ncbi:MAG: HopJ type III effector protein [Colwellia sp.]|nr:HopJ type III effector protein [Colwellia sp.]
MKLNDFLNKLNATPEQVEFSEVMTVISANYRYQPCTFSNGDLTNEVGSNEGSCKIFAFAKLHGLSEEATLACFGQYYREDVLLTPKGTDHKNIRNFIKQGWQGINFEGEVLS